MALVKKINQITIQPIDKTEAIAALEILLSENELVHFKNNRIYFRLSEKTKQLRNTFYGVFNHDAEAIICECIIPWAKYIFVENKKISASEIYNKYIECISLTEKQPMKISLWFPDSLYLNFNRQKSDFVMDIEIERLTIWLFKGFRYEVNHLYSDEETRLLILEDFDKERKKFERLKAKFDELPSNNITYERPRIPERIRIEVWRRDSGKCANCGSRERLEYDHIVPISRGGSNTTRNIELLCEECNRRKSNNIA